MSMDTVELVPGSGEYIQPLPPIESPSVIAAKNAFAQAAQRANIMANPLTTGTGNVENIPAILQALGYTYDPYFDRYKSLWPVLALRHYPPGPEPGDCGFQADEIGAYMCSRALLYGGTCSGQAAIQSAQQSIGVSQMISQATSSIPVVGAVVNAFTSIFGAITAHHAEAVAAEQNNICQALAAFNPSVKQIDAAVISGQISPQQGIQLMSQLVTQTKSILAPTSGAGSGGHPCNAGCCYQAYLDCHLDFAGVFYMDVAPASSMAVPPATYAPAAPASTGSAIADQIHPPPGSATVAQSIPFKLSSGALFLFLLVVFGIIWYVGIR